MRHLLVAPARSTSIKWGAVMLVVAACVGYLIYSASGGSSEYYLTCPSCARILHMTRTSASRAWCRRA
jgi:hypothetical protein